MHSNYSSNTPCSKFGDVINVADANANPTPLPLFGHDDLVAESDNFIQDLDAMLDEIAISNSISSSPSAMTDDSKKPHACRDLRALAIAAEDKASHPGLRQRLESFLDVGLALEEGSRVVQAPNKENAENEDPAKEPKRGRRSQRSQKKSKTRRSKQTREATYSPVVWVIEPSHNKNGTLRFKFTTDAGACLILKGEEVLASIDIMRAASRNNTYFQVYSVGGNSSRVVKPDKISKAMKDLIAESKPKAEEEDVLTIDASSPPRKRIGDRFFRFLLRRRWKQVVRRQVRIAVGDSVERARFESMTFPFAKIWKRFSRRDRTAV